MEGVAPCLICSLSFTKQCGICFENTLLERYLQRLILCSGLHASNKDTVAIVSPAEYQPILDIFKSGFMEEHTQTYIAANGRAPA